jgi:peptidoglycan L-alanyl-D-glutamate endopeptidase CwlK
MKKLEGVHPDLVRVVQRLIDDGVQFRVIEGVRSLERQRALFAAGASKTMKSRHLTGHAVDLAPVVGRQVRWDWPLFDTLAVAVKAAAKAENVPLEWGGNWTSFRDGPHWQLPWAEYPADPPPA